MLSAAAASRTVQLTASGAVAGTAQVTVQVENESHDTVAAIPGSELLQKLQSGGLGDIASSWVSTGANQPVAPARLEQALGTSAVTQAAASAGVDPSQAMGGLAAMLPQLVDKLTPDGDVTPNSNAMLTQVMGVLQGR